MVLIGVTQVDAAIASLVKRGCKVAMVPVNPVQVEVGFFVVAEWVFRDTQFPP